MKPILIAVSIMVNAALAAVLAVRASRATALSSPAAIRSTAAAVQPASAPAVDPETWRQLAAVEPADFIARLRAEGFPPAVIRAIVRALVHERFRARHEALVATAAARPYWRPQANDPKFNAAMRALDREKTAMVQQFLGSDEPPPTGDQLAALQRRYGNLPPVKLAQLEKILSDYNDLIGEVHDTANEILLPEDRAKLALLQKERDADAARLFTGEELVEYELHHSSTANRLQQQLSVFDATEQEFRGLFLLNRAIDAQYGNPGVLNPEQRRARAAALKDLAPQIESALGPERYAEYQQAIDPNYQQVFQLVARLELPRPTAAQVIAVQKDVEKRTAAIYADAALTMEQRQAQFSALNQEATAKLTSSLGATGMDAYKNSGGFWLQNLQRTTTARSMPKQ